MSLIRCPACSNQVSPSAENCPRCGQPIKRGFLGRPGTERVFNVGCLILLTIVALLSCGGFLALL